MSTSDPDAPARDTHSGVPDLGVAAPDRQPDEQPDQQPDDDRPDDDRPDDDRPDDDRPDDGRITLLTTGVLCVFVLLQLRIGLIFADTAPALSDLAVHPLGQRLAARNLWNHGIAGGWSSAWSAGFPVYRFYMSLPVLVAVAFGVVFPDSVALKLTVVLPLVLLPWAVGQFAVAAGLRSPSPTLMAVGSVIFLFDTTQHSFGGNIASTVIGEYGQAWSLLLCIVTFTVFARDLERSRRGPAAGLVGAAAALCHPMGAVIIVVGIVAMVATSARARWNHGALHAARTMLIVGVVGAYWYVPYLWYGAYALDARDAFQTNYLQLLFPFPWPYEAVIGLFAIAGVVDAAIRRRRAVLALAVTSVLSGLAATAQLPIGLSNVRFIPMWRLGLLMLAGAGAAACLHRVALRVPARRRRTLHTGVAWSTVAIAMVMIAWVTGTLPLGHPTEQHSGQWSIVTRYRWLVGPSHDVPTPSQYQNVSFGGIERGPKWGEFTSLISQMQTMSTTRGCGRVGYEFDRGSPFGSLYSLQLLPYYTDDCFTTINGLLTGSPTSNFQFVAESTWSALPEFYAPGLPYESLDMSRAVRYLRELGCKYYITSTPMITAVARRTAGLTERLSVGGTTVFEVDGTALVEPLADTPTVVSAGADRRNWATATMAWFQQADSSAPRIAADGPASWPHAEAATAHAAPTSPVIVRSVVDHGDRISFTVDRPGTPVLVRVSYFPTWSAHGADGPYRVAPNWMVVVPRSTTVELVNTSGSVETLSSWLAVLGLLGCAAWAAWTRRDRFGKRRTGRVPKDTAPLEQIS